MVVALYFSLGGVVAHYKNPRIDPHGIHILYQEKDKVVATLDEPPVEKTRSIKATATISILTGAGLQGAWGKIIIYFKKK